MIERYQSVVFTDMNLLVLELYKQTEKQGLSAFSLGRSEY